MKHKKKHISQINIKTYKWVIDKYKDICKRNRMTSGNMLKQIVKTYYNDGRKLMLYDKFIKDIKDIRNNQIFIIQNIINKNYNNDDIIKNLDEVSKTIMLLNKIIIKEEYNL